jgi:anhydro-N-acetylmuramic acid kinase
MLLRELRIENSELRNSSIHNSYFTIHYSTFFIVSRLTKEIEPMPWGPFADKEVRHAVGLMSGTSCDGVDAALVRLTGHGPASKAELLAFHTAPYPEELRTRLLVSPLDLTARDVCLLNVLLGEKMAEAAQASVEQARDLDVTVDFVASHGHTMAHYPPGQGTEGHGTLQVGEAGVIAERTGLTVISDFRQRDMAAGGQGAPLVPYADWVMFRREDRTVATLNIGGIANFTVVTPELGNVFAFDTGPGNMVIDGAVRMLTDSRETMDCDGTAAGRGTIIQPLLRRLLAHPYFDRLPPKSTGREEFGIEAYLKPSLEDYADAAHDDVIVTVTAAVAQTIVAAYERFIGPNSPCAEIMVSGGGAHNATLMRLVRDGLPDIPVTRTDDHAIPSDAREAVAFAILGDATLHGESGNVPGATGARHGVALGSVTLAGRKKQA